MPYLTQAAYAKHAGISAAQVSKYVKDGRLKRARKMVSGRKLIDRDIADEVLNTDVDPVQRAAQAKAKAKKAGVEYVAPTSEEVQEMQSKVKTAGVGQLSLVEAQRIQAQFKAALLKLEYEEKLKTLVKREQVDVDFFNIARRVRDAILNIPDRIGAELASSTDIFVVKEKLTKSLIQALEELSSEN